MNNDIIDFDLDELADLPEFVTLPAGVYLMEGVTLGQEQREKMGTVITIKAKVLSTVELKNPAVDTPVAEGTEVDYSFPLNIMDKDTGQLNERATAFSQGALKIFTNALKTHYGVGKFSELMEKFPGTQFNAVTTVRVDKQDPEKKFGGVKAIAIS